MALVININYWLDKTQLLPNFFLFKMNKENVCRHFFKVSSKEHHWECKFCSDDEGGSTKVLKQKKGTGWSNLFSHIQSVHKDHQNMMKENINSMFTVPAKVKNMYSWLELIVMKNIPLTWVDDELIRKASCYDPISSNSLKKYMELLCRKMEEELRTTLPQKFGIIFDGWSEGNDHYLALFAIYDHKGETKTPLIAFQPIPDYDAPDESEYQLTAAAHKEFIISTLAFYQREPEALTFLVGDNCSTNKSLATRCGVPLIGCGSHRLNLAVKKFLEPFESILKKIHELMGKLSTIKQAAKLRRVTTLQPIKRNVTRFSSTFSMLKRFFELEEHLDTRDSELIPFIPSRREEQDLRILLSDLKVFESVSKKLQEADINLLVQRKLFDALISKYPLTDEYLGPASRIVHSPNFESGICKIIEGGKELDEDEELELFEFLTPLINDEEDVSFAEQVLKKQRLSHYQDLSFIPPTSNHAERFFSAASFVMTDLRKSTLPKNLEMIMFLKCNREMWDAKLLTKVFNEEKRT